MKRYFAPSELLIEPNGAIYHLGVKPEQLADKVILVGDPNRVPKVAAFFDTQECDVSAREFRTITGTYKGKRISVVGTGIGCDNIDIVVNELDALANIDFSTRCEKEQFRQLQMVRIGTCGGLQEYTPLGSYICSVKSVGFDGLLNFYAGRNDVCDLEFVITKNIRGNPPPIINEFLDVLNMHEAQKLIELIAKWYRKTPRLSIRNVSISNASG